MSDEWQGNVMDVINDKMISMTENTLESLLAERDRLRALLREERELIRQAVALTRQTDIVYGSLNTQPWQEWLARLDAALEGRDA